MAEWKQIVEGSVEVGQLEELTNAADSALTGLAGVLRVIAASLDFLSTLLVETPNLADNVVTKTVQVIEQSILDLLQNNIAYSVHLNAHWNPDWKYRRAADDPKSIPDFYNDGVLPLVGTGIQGWLLDLAFSTQDPSDPFRPVSDSDTSVYGVIFVAGVPSDGELQELRSLLKVFTNYRHLDNALLMQDELDTATDAFKALLRMGPMATDAAVKAIARPISELAQDVYGTFIASGASGTNEASSPTFIDLNALFTETVVAGDTLRVQDSNVFYEVLEVVDDTTLRVSPSFTKARESASTWSIRRGGISSLISKLPQDVREFIPVAGAYPKWVSVPIASLVPLLSGLFTGLEKMVDLFRVGTTQASALRKLSLLLRQKAQVLGQVIDELQGLLEIVVALINFFESAHIIVLSVDSGGVSRFVNEAAVAKGLPDFGPRGIVIGMTALATADDPSNHLESLFNFIGINASSYADVVTKRAKALSDTWDDEY